jgi:MarR family transcriptional regulator, organic hydroperoxide resistance regulator
MPDDAVRRVQISYPQIYLACHTRHQRARSSSNGLSARDSALLAHLDETRATTPTALARHLGIGKPTMSAALKRLKDLGYVTVTADPGDRRTLLVRLGTKGAAAMRASSVLEAARVRRVLRVLTADERERALSGLELLARASQHIMRKERRRA